MRNHPAPPPPPAGNPFVAILVIGLAFIGFMVWAGNARGHGQAAWIQQSPDFSWCCSTNDCAMLPSDGVRVVPGGYFIVETGETIPEEKAKPSPDGEFWRCRTDAADPKSPTRCFFRSPPGS